MSAASRGDLVYGFRLSMEEVARVTPQMEEVARRFGASPAPGALPLEILKSLGYAVHPLSDSRPGAPVTGRAVLVGWSLLEAAPAGAEPPGASAVDRERLLEAASRAERLLEALRLSKPLGYHLVSPTAPAPDSVRQ